MSKKKKNYDNNNNNNNSTKNNNTLYAVLLYTHGHTQTLLALGNTVHGKFLQYF